MCKSDFWDYPVEISKTLTIHLDIIFVKKWCLCVCKKMKNMRVKLQKKYTQIFLMWKPSTLGEGENHKHKLIKYSTILWIWLQWSIMLQWRKRKGNSGDKRERKGGKKASTVVSKCVYVSTSFSPFLH